jgi:response regulator RpfG family c-di-GMP phosphodiesterase
VFDALSSVRCYKPAWPEERVLELMRTERGRAFDPELIDILFDRLAEVRAVRAASPEEPD